MTTMHHLRPLLILALALFAGSLASAGEQVWVDPVVLTASEGAVPTTAVLRLRRNPAPNATLTVDFSLADTVNLTRRASVPGAIDEDYDLTVAGNPITVTGTSGQITFPAGAAALDLVITPIDDSDIEGLEYIQFALTPNPTLYGLGTGGPSSASVIIADDDLQATAVGARDASEDPALISPGWDPGQANRGVLRVEFDQAFTFDRSVQVNIAGSAIRGTDYQLTYKIGGAGLGNGIGWRVAAFPSDTVNPSSIVTLVLNSGQTATLIPDGTVIAFSDNPGQSYVTVGDFTGPGDLEVTAGTAGLLTPVLDGAQLIVSGIPDANGDYAVNSPLLAGSLSMVLTGGHGELMTGDTFTIAGAAGSYVATSDQDSGGTVGFRRYTGGTTPGEGLDSTLSTPGALLTTVSSASSTALLLLVPAESTQIEFGVTPGSGGFANDGLVEGRETVTLTLVNDNDYLIGDPGTGSILIRDIDCQASISVPPNGNAGMPGTSGRFVVTLSQAFSSDVTVHYSVGGTAIPDTDYGALDGELLFPAGTTSREIAVTPIDHSPFSLATVSVTLNDSPDYKRTNSSATLSILPFGGAAGISGPASAAFESPIGAGTRQFTITLDRTGASGDAVDIQYQVTGTATSGVDFTALSGHVLIAAGMGNGTGTITLAPIDNAVVEADETVSITLLSGPGYTLSPTATSASTTILDDEPTLSIATDSGAAPAEPATAGALVIGYPGVPVGTALTRDVTVTIAYGGTATANVDYTAITTAVIPAGSLAVTVPLAPIDDQLIEGSEVITASIVANPTVYRIAVPAIAPLILTDDEPTLAITASVPDAEEPGTDGEFTVSFEAPATPLPYAVVVPVVFTGTAVRGTDFNCAPFVLIPAGDTSATLSIVVADDTIAENDETVIATIAPGAGYLVTTAAATLTIADNEPTVTVTKVDDAPEDGSSAGTFRISYPDPPLSQNVVVGFALSGSAVITTDYTATATTQITIPSGSSEVDVEITGVADAFGNSPDRQVILTLLPATTGAANGYHLGTTTSETMTITDDEPAVSVSVVPGTIAEGANAVVFTITRAPVTASALAVTYSLTGTATGGDYNANPGSSVTLPASGATATVSLNVTNDGISEGDETVILTITRTATSPYRIDPTAGSATKTIADQDLSVSSIGSTTPSGTYHLGDSIDVRVVFSGAVTVTGTPLLQLETGSVDRSATYVSGSGSATLVFTYQVQSGDSSADLDHLSTTALTLNGGTIVRASGAGSVILTLPAPGSANSLANGRQLVIDGSPTSGKPTPGSVTSNSGGGGCGVGSGIAAFALALLSLCRLALRRRSP